MNSTSECKQTLLVQADFDGELDAAQAAALIRHREECAECRAAQEKLERARALLRTAPRYSVSAELRERLGRAIDERARSDADVSRIAKRDEPSALPPARWQSPPRARQSAWRAPVGWAAAAAVALMAVVLVVAPRSTDISAQLVSNHLRAMQLDSHLIDVVSTDHHTVKPWFAGKVDFAPPVRELDADGYVLKGGRVDIVEARTAAVLVYQAGRHTVEVFIWPTRPGEHGGPAFQSQQLDGFNLRRWEEGGLEVWCISDMAAEELDRFVSRWRSAS